VKRLALLGSLALVCFAAAFAATAPAAARCTPTLSDGAGPFSRGAPPIRARIGTGHVLTGVVLSTDCKPLGGARVQVWQAANRKGDYTLASSATVIADRSGRFRFEGPRPVSYSGRPPHIHLRVIADQHEILYARYVPAPGARRGTVRLVLEPEAL
jgi:protocatechuate 3,4-dioxygenase beta subunit